MRITVDGILRPHRPRRAGNDLARGRAGARVAGIGFAVSSPMARALWKGSISFGLVSVPIGLVSAIAGGESLTFHLLHGKDGARIKQKRFCEEEDVEVPWSAVVKGYQHAKGRYVVVTEGDLERARGPATHTFEIRRFVPASDVEDLYFEHPYYAQPEGRSATRPYALLRDVLAESGKIGIGTIVLRQREHLAALEPAGRALVLTTMRFAHEIRPPTQLDLPGSRAGWTDEEMKLARQLVETLADTWNPTEFRDTYTEVLRRVIDAKVEGREIVAPQAPRRARVANLTDALQKSLAGRPLAKAAARRPAARKTRPDRRKAA